MGMIPKWLWDREQTKAKAEEEAASARAKEATDHKAWLRDNAESVHVPEHPAVTLLREIEWRGTCPHTDADQCMACHSTPKEGHATDCKLAAILADKPGDRILAELLAEERERGRQEAELAESRKGAAAEREAPKEAS